MEGCWSRRGCDDEMQGRCPHNVPGEPCPADCHYAACHRPTHVVCEDFGVLLNPNRDYDAAVKQVCRFCEHFLRFAPRVGEDGSLANVAPDQVTSEEDNRFKIHLF